MNETILILAILGNICNLAYNIPFIYVVWKHWNANNISKKFLVLRIIGSLIWIAYCIIINDLLIGLSYSVILLSSGFILYVKINQSPSPITSPITSPSFTMYKESFV